MGKRKERNFKKNTVSVSMDSKKLNTCLKDFISSLPPEVLGNILSRLPTKLAASTSVLSKKWRNLFLLVHNLDFDDSVFVKPLLQSDNYNNTLECFKNFVDRTLALQCGSSINKFSLKFQDYDNCQTGSLRRWISNVVDRGVLEFYLRLCFNPLDIDGDFPYLDLNPLSELFMSKTLVKLTLGERLVFDKFPFDVYLPALKILSIKSILFCYQDEDIFSVLLAGCPVLDELSIHHADFEGSPYHISSQTIKKLIIYCNSDSFVEGGFEMSLDAPNLVSLDYTAIVYSHYVDVNIQSLVEARLNLTSLSTITDPNIAKLINGISNVQTLHLSPDTIEVIYSSGILLPVFNNLVNLSFGCYDANGWNMLPYLLNHTPKLETLTIQSLAGYTDNVTLRPFQVKVLRVLGFGNTTKEMEDFRSLVWGTKCLVQVEVEINRGVAMDHHRIWRNIKGFLEIAASNCNIGLKIS